jgi:secreted trypsin-like serine protease
MCTATLIGTRTVLTASHCVTEQKKAPYSVVAQLDFVLGGQKYLSASVVMHPQYDFPVWDSPDVAVVRLSQAVTGVQPIVVAMDQPKVGEAITVVGFGQTATNNTVSSGTKRIGTATINKVDPQAFEFNGTASSICYGDSGGPTFATRQGMEVQIGVHAVLAKSGLCEDGGGNTRLDAYHDWISKQAQGDMAQQDTAPPQVQFLSPKDKAVVAPSFSIDVSAQDDLAVTQIELYIDGKLVETSQSPSLSYQANLPAGMHTIRAEALDPAKRKGSTEVQVTVQSPQSPPPNQPPPQQQPPQSNYGQAPNVNEIVGACSMGMGMGMGMGRTAPTLPWWVLCPPLLLWLRRRPKR